ncbi:MAG: peptidoglycan bridge formation glycyltransferase FemA/FemB family protein [Bacteroidales bacterium]
MFVKIESKSINSIKSNGVLQQTSWWADVKCRQGYDPRAFHLKLDQDDTYPKTDDILVIMREDLAKNKRMAYIPYGPEILPHEDHAGIFLEDIAENLRPHLPNDCNMIRFDLKWESPWLKDENRYNNRNEWIGLPPEQTQELRMNFCTENHNLYKAPGDILPSSTIYLDLEKSKEELLSKMKPKTRYNIRLSKRHKIQVREADENDLYIWYELYKETAKRNHIFCHHFSTFENMMEANNQNPENKTGTIMLVAEHENEPLAAMWLGISSVQATYLYGASSVRKRNLMPSYALQWAAICRAKDLGCKYYDMFGIAPTDNPAHPMHGLFRFKRGFGGQHFLRYGCWDYPFDHAVYQQFRSLEMKAKGYHL